MADSNLPRGARKHCPICRTAATASPDVLCGNCNCHACGEKLWYFNYRGSPFYYPAEKAKVIRVYIVSVWQQSLGTDLEKSIRILETGRLEKLAEGMDSDSMDIVELVMEFEEGLQGLELDEE